MHLSWVTPILLQQLHSIPPDLKVTIHIHVTKHYRPRGAPTQLLPTNPADSDDVSWQTYLTARAAQSPRRTSRLMSTMSWATFTDAFDPNGPSGPGTRRGSMAVTPLTASFKLTKTLGDSDLEESIQGGAPAFSWTEGYGGSTIPSEFGVRASPFHSRLASIPVILAEDDEGSSGPNTRTGSSFAHSPFDSTSTRSSSDPYTRHPDPVTRGSVTLEVPARTRQRSIAIEEPFSPHRMSSSPFDSTSSRGSLPRSSFARESLSVAQTYRQRSISIEEPESPRRKSSAASSGNGKSPVNSRKTSLLNPAGRPSLLITFPTEPSPTFSPSTPLSSLLRPGPAPMLKTDSFASISPISGQLTPALSFTGATSFAEDEKARRRQSAGLDGIVQWHEGRADLLAAIEALKADVPEGGTISVNACGPRSLLEGAKDAVKASTTMRDVWRGGVVVDFHAETFGW